MSMDKMPEGLWASPTEYVSFSEFAGSTRAVSSALSEEIYTSAAVTGFNPAGWLGLMPDPDPVLRKTGDGVSVLRDLTADDKVISAIQSRKLGILKKKDYMYEPGHDAGQKADKESERICKLLEQDLSKLDLYNIFSQVLDAPYYGQTVVEIIWRPENGFLHIESLKPRPVEWFGYNQNEEPVFKSSYAAEPIPFGKAVIARHFPDAVNPYGLRLLSRCLWPVAIKKGGIQFWTTLCERFGMPWVIGTARQGADKTERNNILSSLTAMVQDAVAVVTGGTEVKLHGIEGRGGDLHPQLIQFMNSAIATVIMGQTLTAEVGSSGSRALGQVHESILNDYRDADETLVTKFMQEIGFIYQQINSSSAHPPSFRYLEAADYAGRADLDNKLYTTGVRFTPAHFEKKYDLANDEFTVTDPTEPTDLTNSTDSADSGSAAADLDRKQNGNAKKTPAGAKGNNFSASGSSGSSGSSSSEFASKFTKEQQKIEDLVDNILPDASEALNINEEAILKKVESSDSYDEAFEAILDLYPSLSVASLQSAVERVILNADLYGRFQAGKEAK